MVSGPTVVRGQVNVRGRPVLQRQSILRGQRGQPGMRGQPAIRCPRGVMSNGPMRGGPRTMMRPVLNGRGGTLPVRGRGGPVRSQLVLARSQGWQMVPQSGISLQTPIDHQNNSFVHYNAAMRSMASASETIDADDFMKEFNFLQGKEEPNSNDVLAKVLSLSGINESDISSHRQDILAEAIASSGISCMNP